MITFKTSVVSDNFQFSARECLLMSDNLSF